MRDGSEARRIDHGIANLQLTNKCIFIDFNSFIFALALVLSRGPNIEFLVELDSHSIAKKLEQLFMILNNDFQYEPLRCRGCASPQAALRLSGVTGMLWENQIRSLRDEKPYLFAREIHTNPNTNTMMRRVL